MIYFLWFQVETTSVKKRDIRFIAGKDDYTKSLSVIKTPSIFVQWIEINSHFLTDAIVRNSMTFNLIQSINLQRPFLGMESLTETMGSLRFGQWHRRPFYKEFLSKDRIQLGFLQKFDKLWFGGKLRRLHPLPRQCTVHNSSAKGFMFWARNSGDWHPKVGVRKMIMLFSKSFKILREITF